MSADPPGPGDYTIVVGHLSVYIQPGGCIEITDGEREIPNGDGPEMVHICGSAWGDVMDVVALLAAAYREDGRGFGENNS